jgi:hypothetical protein
MLEKLPESVGHALINQRAGMANVVYNQLHRLRETARIDLRSKAFMFRSASPRTAMASRRRSNGTRCQQARTPWC